MKKTLFLLILAVSSLHLNAQHLRGKFSTKKQNIGSGVIAWKTIEFHDGFAIWEWYRDYSNSQTESNGGQEWTILTLFTSSIENGKITLTCDSKEELRSDREEAKVRTCFPNPIQAEIAENGVYVRNGDNDGLYSGTIPIEVKEILSGANSANQGSAASGSAGASVNPASGRTFSAINDTPDNLFEGILKEFDPEGYADISYMKGMQAQGERLVNGLVQKVNQYGTLIQTNDPAALLADFQSKFSTLQDIQANYESQSFDFGYQRGQQLSNQISSNDYQGAFINSISFLTTLGEMRKAEKELEARKQALEQQKRNQMFEIYRKAWEKNRELKNLYLERAAFAESLNDEQTNLNYVYHLVCYLNSMTRGIDSNSNNWYVNRCSAPKESTNTALANNLISKDRQLLNIADRKLALYQKYGDEEFLDAAISFTAKAVNENPIAENYLKLADLYSRSSNILSLVALETAKSLDPSLFQGDVKGFYERVKGSSTDEISRAIRENNVDYIQSFVELGLDQYLRINGETLLSYAIDLDQPDAVQVILNTYVDGLDQSEVTKYIQNTILLAAIQNSPKTLERFVALGIDLNFEKSGTTPIDVAADYLSLDAFEYLVSQSANKSAIESKFKGSKIYILQQAKVDPSRAAILLDQLSNESSREQLINKMLMESSQNSNIFETLFKSEGALERMMEVPEGNKKARELFIQELAKPSPESKAVSILESGILDLESLPTIADIIGSPYSSVGEVVEPVSNRGKLERLLLNAKETYERNKENGYPDDMSPKTIKQYEGLLRNWEEVSSNAEKAISYSYLVNGLFSPSGEFPDPYYSEAQKLYTPNSRINLEKKAQGLIAFLKELRNDFLPFQRPFIDSNIKNLEDGNASYIQNVNKQYAALAFINRLPMDRAMIELFNPNTTSADLVNENENIAIVAFQTGNLEAFNWLSDKFDVYNVKSVTGETILELLLNDEKPIALKKDFLEKDLINTLSSKVDKLNLLRQQMVKIRSNPTSKTERFNLVRSTFSLFGADLNSKFSKSGGTLLHWVVDQVIEGEDYIVAILELDVDLSIKDKNGLTAEGYLKQKGKPFLKKIKVNHTYEGIDGTINYKTKEYADPRGTEVEYLMNWFKQQ